MSVRRTDFLHPHSHLHCFWEQVIGSRVGGDTWLCGVVGRGRDAGLWFVAEVSEELRQGESV